MKRLIALVVLVFGLFLASGPLAIAQPQLVTLLHVNDTHSHLDAWGPKDANLDGTLGGLPKAAAIIAAEKAADPSALFVHAGDFMNGDLFFNEYLGVPELQLLQSIGLDALVLGNRDFQQGPLFLNFVLASAWPGSGVPILGTNLDLTAASPGVYPALHQWVTSTLIKDVNGVKVGFFGLTLPKGPLANPKPVKILPYLATIAPQAVTGLRGAGAQVVICVSHLGMDLARELARQVPGIDVIVNAHDNAELQQPEPVDRPGGGTTLIVSAGSYYRWVGRLRLSVDGEQVRFVDYALLGADAATPAAPAVRETIDVLKAGIVARYGDVYHQPLNRAIRDITPQWNPDHAWRDTPLGNLFTDAYRARTGTEIAFEGIGLLDDPVLAGPVVGADVFRAMSLTWSRDVVLGQQTPVRLRTFRASGDALIKALETLFWLGGSSFPQVSGMRIVYDSSLPSLHRILSVEVGDLPLVGDQLYGVTTTDYVYSILSTLIATQDAILLPDLAFDAARSFVQSHGVLQPGPSNRIRDVAAIPGPAR